MDRVPEHAAPLSAALQEKSLDPEVIRDALRPLFASDQADEIRAHREPRSTTHR